MSRELQEEIEKMSEEELLVNMRKIMNSELSYDEISKYNEQYFAWVSSIEMLKSDPRISFDKYKKNNNLKKHNYNKVVDIEILKDYEYIYIN